MTEETKHAGAPEELVELFDRVVGQYPDAERRHNQGFPGADMNGNLLCDLTEDRVMLRLSERDRETFLEQDDASACEPSEEDNNAELEEFVMTPTALMEDEALLDRWLGKSFTYVSTLPDKPGSRNNSRGNNGNSIHARDNSNQRSNRNNPRNNRGRKKTSKKTSRKTGGGGGRKKTSRKTGGRRNNRGRPQGQRSQGGDQG